jgi:hypothetical protein
MFYFSFARELVSSYMQPDDQYFDVWSKEDQTQSNQAKQNHAKLEVHRHTMHGNADVENPQTNQI